MNIIIVNDDILSSHIGSKSLVDIPNKQLKSEIKIALQNLRLVGCKEVSVTPQGVLFNLGNGCSEKWITLKSLIEKVGYKEGVDYDRISFVLKSAFYYFDKKFEKYCSNVDTDLIGYKCVFCESIVYSRRIGKCNNSGCETHKIRKEFEPGYVAS